MSEANTETRQRFGAHTVVDTLVDEGVNVFFANPGTSEIHLVQAIDENPLARAVLCLFEGVATGAGDGYARASGTPAAVLLHLGPGLANGLANLHNAYKAGSPMIVIVGDHAIEHLQYDTPLRSDVGMIAGFAAKAVYRLTERANLQDTIRAAVHSARSFPSGPVVVVANADVMWGPAASAQDPSRDSTAEAITRLATSAATSIADRTEEAADMLRRGSRAALVLGGDALSAKGLELADRIALATGCQVFSETFNARHERGAGIPSVERLPYFREAAVERLSSITDLVLAGSRPPVAFFASPGHRSELARAEAKLLALSEDQPVIPLLLSLADGLSAPTEARLAERIVPAEQAGPLTPRAIWSILSRLLPTGAIVSDEAGVTSVGADAMMQNANPHIWLNLTGGSIGLGLPLATGAAIAAPDNPVVAVHGDGGAMYTVQALWTQARERAHVVNVIFRNDRYAILQHETKRHGLGPLGPKGARMFDLSDPPIRWTPLAAAMGVKGVSVTTAEELSGALADALETKEPRVIEVLLGSR